MVDMIVVVSLRGPQAQVAGILIRVWCYRLSKYFGFLGVCFGCLIPGQE